MFKTRKSTWREKNREASWVGESNSSRLTNSTRVVEKIVGKCGVGTRKKLCLCLVTLVLTFRATRGQLLFTIPVLLNCLKIHARPQRCILWDQFVQTA